ncbi:hypothetical protein VD0002_g2489 [Verticillium dahliae]|uniref:C2H2-type domain-containing protein n=2 Tax=Verticillium TaxID=1036719 RepID=A0A2J8DXT9_VERDA|nr:C2H2 type zinc finger domain-containing protein [Verticillium dahliae]PNH36083.1 hypothetical protein BJF96_g1065 [Verticillium dahliae]PNH42884.1 hypothetical protein VD0004_g4504 [Verticillium dahliae]PNH54087.1 hypothetical protein VD0003_g3404 [Verticillium dahliae]PNH67073.1 hypothetical protein VD0002_g2489 [Verticillium dahliae]
MITSAIQQPNHYQPAVSDFYDPDDVLPHDSPQMNSFRPKLEPSPSPPPQIPPVAASHRQGDAVLINFLSNGKRPDIARAIAVHSDHSDAASGAEDDPSISSSPSTSSASCKSPPFNLAAVTAAAVSTSPSEPGAINLINLAAGALAFTTGNGPDPLRKPTADSTLVESVRSDTMSSAAPQTSRVRFNRPLGATVSEPLYPSEGFYTATPPGHSMRHAEVVSPMSPLQPALGGLPPLQIDSPKSDSPGHGSLPSIRQHFGDLALSPDKELPGPLHSAVAAYPRPSPAIVPRMSSIPSLSGRHPSPPTSPNNGYGRHDLPSPAQSLISPGHYYQTHNGPPRMGNDKSGCFVDTPSNDQPSLHGSTVPMLDRMSIDGLTNPQPGGFICEFAGCTAPPFQTQYLLNSHANVHSSARPHYCAVPGCPRSEGGKGFKRKNEMIRHGLVHESPGYVCPFCPDREHKYPRPDNLQRHVRVHHVGTDKDDPLLREVLSQRPDGPNRGRRRRGGTT